MQLMPPPGRLDRPVDHKTEHVLGPSDAEITLVEYGSYACPHRRAANERIAHGRLMAAIIIGLAVGKPVGVFLAAAAAVRAGIAAKPAGYTWRQLAGAGALAGIGFTMSLFIAGQAFPDATAFSAAKVAVFAASVLSTVAGTVLLWGASRQELIEEAPQGASVQGS